MADMPSGETPAQTLKRRALIRLAIAGAITVAALAGLWWLDKSSAPPAERKPTPPKPIITAPETAPPPSPEVAQPAPPSSAEAVEPSPPPQPATMPPPPAPPKVSNVPPPSTAEPTPAAVPRPAPRSEGQPAPRSEGRPAPRSEGRPAQTMPPAAEPPQSAGRGYMLQLGVFSNPDNAKQLLERLKREGIQAQSETRVQVGPFQRREEAEKARLALERLGIQAVITLQAATR